MSANPQKILHIAGWSTCGFYKRASTVLASLSTLFPNKIKVVDHTFPSRAEYRAWLIDGGFRDKVIDARAHNHASSPFTWIATSASVGNLRGVAPESLLNPDPADIESFIGGCDDTLEWCRLFCSPSSSDNDGPDEVTMAADGHTTSHGYDYDLVVIGGGSGGLATSKEASALGAKVAVLDYVKPSPAGSVWGLGGTCVNVGCIPKKLMHNAALVNESMHHDTAAFGISAAEKTQHDWENMRQNVQNHIRGLNFKYRVNLRENEVNYINKLGKFIDPHTIEVVDKNGEKSTITSSRFLIAVGGRPTPLNCEGGDLAISSDDIFSLEKSPGKTLCVGASYISLECAGFLNGLGYDTTVAVRSILLRGFDRECADKIGDFMKESGVKFRMEVTPQKLEKLENGKINVTFSDGSQEEYDTVLCAIGRQADTESLGLENIPQIETNPKNKKIVCTHEQTGVPNIYAIGDVMEGCPELTPVAIQAGLSLANRLFAGSKEAMNYKKIATTVFTPIEYGTIGYSEEDAIEKFGDENIDVYHKEFIPLEWSISEGRWAQKGFTKVIVNKSEGNEVLGIHYVGPNAGEVMQGYGVAMKKGITFKDLEDTVGIHPTCSEEIVTLKVTKSSGADAAAGGC
eukprot:CAMPEP_0178968562 /NCGR_PEP_ID=MMETSP0789-20121207/18340_1 /TAXON_ID=3005 /ORGANISM="Rhizosolenia setigera, Strain CCMP 1694" /LENGTH=628 /DNA_ID=CAMNT_0020654539 /DNA_START=51 /DNA_END=1937 /DNA_ORIENTATION=+